MDYFDTNVLIYFVYQTQSKEKFEISERLIKSSLSSNRILLSPLILQEFIYTAFKIDKNKERIREGMNFFSRYCRLDLSLGIVFESFELADKMNYFKNINDCIHLKFAEKYCDKLTHLTKTSRNSDLIQN